MSNTYRDSFTGKDFVEYYEKDLFADHSYARLLTGIEHKFLDNVLARFPDPEKVSYLDFACGTGRILQHLEDRVGVARGIEISDKMLAYARPKMRRANLIHKDITASGDEIEGRYDLITSFRFFQNAEAPLRQEVIDGLVKRMKDESSILVFNIQGITGSYRILSWLYSSLCAALRGTRASYRTMSHGEALRMIEDAGLELLEIYGYDLLSGKVMLLLGYDMHERLEINLAGKSLANAIGGHRIYVTRRKRIRP